MTAEHPPKRKTGFTPTTWAMLDSNLSGDSALLLTRLRRLSDDKETDGFVEQRDVDALVAFHKLSKRRIAGCLDELISLGFLKDRGAGVYLDTEFLTVCRSHDERAELRAAWVEEKRARRLNSKPQMSTVESPVESTPESAVDSFVSPSVAPSPAVSPSPAAAPTHVVPAEPNEPAAFMPSAVDTTMIVRTWEGMVGRHARPDETRHVQWFLSMFDLTANDVVGIIKRIHAREAAKGNRIGNLEYFDSAVRDASATSKPSRSEMVRGIDEPPDPLPLSAAHV
jgi:hypothetical protein